MRQMLRRLWNDDTGALIATEWVFLVSIMVLGVIGGLLALRQSVLSETTELAQAIMALNQSYSFSGQANCEAFTAGSSAIDTVNSISETSFAVGGNSTGLVTQIPCD